MVIEVDALEHAACATPPRRASLEMHRIGTTTLAAKAAKWRDEHRMPPGRPARKSFNDH